MPGRHIFCKFGSASAFVVFALCEHGSYIIFVVQSSTLRILVTKSS